MKVVYEIESGNFEIDYSANGIKAKLQNVRFILNSMANSCVLAREIGFEAAVDAPIQIAPALNSTALIQAINKYDTTIVVESIDTDVDAQTGKIKFKVKVNFDD